MDPPKENGKSITWKDSQAVAKQKEQGRDDLPRLKPPTEKTKGLTRYV